VRYRLTVSLRPTAYRAAQKAIARPPTEIDPREVYHSLCPLPLMSPVPNPADPETIARQLENEAAYRELLVQGVLSLLLPTEDIANPCLTSLVGQIFSELIIGNVIANKASQPWLIWEGLSILARGRQQSDGSNTAKQKSVSFQDRVQLKGTATKEARGWSVQRIFFLIIHWAFLLFTCIKIIFDAIAMVPYLPTRTKQDMKGDDDVTGHNDGLRTPNPTVSVENPAPVKVPVALFKAWPCIANLAEVDVRMPWLSSGLSLLQLAALRGPGGIAGRDGVVDR
jgi:hypothetical protein